jgi:hypothetical protein
LDGRRGKAVVKIIAFFIYTEWFYIPVSYIFVPYHTALDFRCEVVNE